MALDLNLDERLIQEGIAREFINRIQNQRKDMGLDVIDKIRVNFQSDPQLDSAVFENIMYIKQEILAEEIQVNADLKEGFPLEFDAINTIVEIQKL